ncbi:MAG: hypothetical protein K2K57_10580, partial [Oscillospiraceae bacterium]|nr:hypothetical protein [Oscillospiraceae bacterium]
GISDSGLCGGDVLLGNVHVVDLVFQCEIFLASQVSKPAETCPKILLHLPLHDTVFSNISRQVNNNFIKFY